MRIFYNGLLLIGAFSSWRSLFDIQFRHVIWLELRMDTFFSPVAAHDKFVGWYSVSFISTAQIEGVFLHLRSSARKLLKLRPTRFFGATQNALSPLIFRLRSSFFVQSHDHHESISIRLKGLSSSNFINWSIRSGRKNSIFDLTI